MNALSRVVELSNFIICPQTSKWSNSTFPTKMRSPKNRHFSYFSKKTYVVGTHQKCLSEFFSNEYPKQVFFKKNIYIYLIIWILFLARDMKSLSQDKLIEISYLFSRIWDRVHKPGHDIFKALLHQTFP